MLRRKNIGSPNVFYYQVIYCATTWPAPHCGDHKDISHATTNPSRSFLRAPLGLHLSACHWQRSQIKTTPLVQFAAKKLPLQFVGTSAVALLGLCLWRDNSHQHCWKVFSFRKYRKIISSNRKGFVWQDFPRSRPLCA